MCNKTSTLAKEQNIANTSENPHVCHLIHSLFSKDIHYPNYVYDFLNTLLFSFAGFMDFCKRNITGCAPLCLISFTWYHVFWDTYMSSSVFVICPLSVIYYSSIWIYYNLPILFLINLAGRVVYILEL